MTYTFRPKGVCSQLMEIDTEGSRITGLKVYGGCDGNLKAIGRLLEGSDARQAADTLRGNLCGKRGTSCADQLAKSIDEVFA